ncbi:conserved hypothetical protein [Frankia canadensis]|uniref:Asp23/Gls24 family envelope stress response protein n=1 Tax=Frankia canadensis TaxID=1836972 RepID=A0A2I2L0Z9_9ACTN|nr:Asp23/Gls24 family envelope stress response protein [Frankia canadensis]SNQ51603.1 conserved hypothetical protein [Frankia canadensis]SOU58893.1 conserved hypothetical protein [Frankia canadensis]
MRSHAGPDAAVVRHSPAGAGSLRVADRVVEKIAVTAAAEVFGVAGAPRRLGGSRAWGRRPRATARVRGGEARLTMAFAVRYPASVDEITGRVRVAVRERVAAFAGIRVARLDIAVPALRVGDGSSPSVLDRTRDVHGMGGTGDEGQV